MVSVTEQSGCHASTIAFTVVRKHGAEDTFSSLPDHAHLIVQAGVIGRPAAASADEELLGVGRAGPFPVQVERPRREREDLARGFL